MLDPGSLLIHIFGRSAAEADVIRRGFHVTDPAHRDEIEHIGVTFLAGYNAALREASAERLRRILEDRPPYDRPFAHEGAAMGFGVRAALHAGWCYNDFERRFIPALGDNYLYLYYVGLGWWFRLRYQHQPWAVMGAIARYDPRYRYLCLDGYGFMVGFYGGARLERARALSRLPGYGVHAAMQGYGRSLWFLYRDDPDGRAAAIAAFPQPFQGDLWAGWGLAAAFTQIAQPAEVFRLAEHVPVAYRPDYYQGAVFGWVARRRADPDAFARWCAGLDEAQRTGISSACDACDVALMEAVAQSTSEDTIYAAWRIGTRTRAQLLLAGQGILV
jgi:hypothetical protein